ncbi:Pyruvate dehydrogenase E1 component [Aquicella lusitana]|uniref:Pyruvate dehydrogenase E1 component n=2 Tax=Aquicella lusitana TaxID=254246 RepID=A0A370G5G1_9COXI|nr:pyruvate dehydrogenase (acetyl-transferring), homodimeric type [Aquicella lusitana]RDI38450.1 pyruvate dehydrogenase E1 component [Aquicella lusitana]VVC73759.1 Pyruvate dehydrogenase E1 component [Aquicella lusitana]
MTKTWSDNDPVETKEWLDSLASLIRYEGKERAQFILQALLAAAEQQGVKSGLGALMTSYCNTLSAEDQPDYPGDLKIEAAIEAILRWNAIAMVLQAKSKAGGVGGHLSSFASIATLYEVGMHHFFRGPTKDSLGDLVYFQGHSSEGNYARAFLEGRISEKQLKHFRQEAGGEGVSSYPHPWLMPNFWQFATVSLGLGMLQGVYQARFLHYLENRGLLPAGDRKVWVFCGDGEMDEPDAIAGLTLAGREKLDNLVFVVNCNLQRLDGLVRSNYKVVQELESLFRGAGWHVIKVLWGSGWDKLFAKDKTGALVKRLTECVDGDLQTAYVRGGAYTREFLFNTDELKALVADWSDEEIAGLKRGAHDPVKIYAAYHAATRHKGQPTVILTQGVKGYGLGTTTAEGRNVAHNQLDLTEEELKAFRDRFNLPLNDKELLSFSFYKPEKDSAEMQYLQAQREKLGGYLPSRRVESHPLTVPDLSVFDAVLKGSGDRAISTTMALGRILNVLLKEKEIGPRIVPIFSDEVRTFGLETLFRQVGIYSSVGQRYTPEDKEQFLYYHEAKDGQVLEEGITEAGCMASWIAAATSYATHQFPMVPFFTYYSMFGFQRVGDYIWAASDMRARGFLIGATAGRTTLEGEGLQHQDGNSLLIASTFPTCRAYDPAYGYEMAVIIQHGLKEMYAEEKDVFYYIMAMNERYAQPAMPEGVEEGIIRGMYLFQKADTSKTKHTVQLLGSGAILNEVIEAAALLKKDFDIAANVWSVTSFSELRRDGAACERENMLVGDKKPAVPYVAQCLKNQTGPVIAATDYVRAYADLIRPYLERTYVTLGTDGFGRSDTRESLRRFFEVDRYYIVVAALYALVKEGELKPAQVAAAMKKYGIDPKKPNPVTV